MDRCTEMQIQKITHQLLCFLQIQYGKKNGVVKQYFTMIIFLFVLVDFLKTICKYCYKNKTQCNSYTKKGIRCNAILPGTVETPSWEGRVQMADDPIQARKDFIARQAMGRLAQPNEIASMALYLASDESDFVTGTLNLIDGGWTL